MQLKNFKALCIILILSMLSVGLVVSSEVTVVDGVTHFGTLSGNSLEIEAEEVTINRDTTIVNGTPTSINMIGMWDTMPAAGEMGDVEFSFNTGSAGEYVVWIYANPTSAAKYAWFERNNGAYGKVMIGSTVSQYQWTPVYYFTAAGDDYNKMRVISGLGYYKIDKFVVAKRGYNPATGVYTTPTTTIPPEPTPTPEPPPTPKPDPKAIKIMPVGDSITSGASSGGYRPSLWNKYVAAGKNVNFVGSARSGNLTDQDHEGHAGWRIHQIDANIVNWVQQAQPDIVLLMIGTNDMGQSDASTAHIRLSGLIDNIADTKPGVKIFVASIPLRTDTTSLTERIATFNAAIPPMVAAKVSEGKDVYFVDIHSVLTAGDLSDGIHPNGAGYEKVATAWFDASVEYVVEKAEDFTVDTRLTLGENSATARLTIENTLPEGNDKTVTAILGRYSGNKLMDVSIKEYTVKAGNPAIRDTIQMPFYEGERVKLLVWDKVTMQPLATPKIVENTQQNAVFAVPYEGKVKVYGRTIDGAYTTLLVRNENDDIVYLNQTTCDAEGNFEFIFPVGGTGLYFVSAYSSGLETQMTTEINFTATE